MKMLLVLTSHDQLGNTGRNTGFWLEEIAAPSYVFKDAGVNITLASPKGGRPPLDPKSNESASRTELTIRFEKDAAAQAQLDKTLRLDSVKHEAFDTVFYPGGHGPMRDLAEDEDSIKLIESFIAAGKPNRHRLPFRRGVASRQDGGRQVLGSRRGSDRLHQRRGGGDAPHQGRPFLVEDEMLRLGAIFSKKADWAVHVVSDGLLTTGQNPASSGPAAKTLMAAVKQRARPAAAARNS